MRIQATRRGAPASSTWFVMVAALLGGCATPVPSPLDETMDSSRSEAALRRVSAPGPSLVRPVPMPTTVWTAPLGYDLPCSNERLAFAFDPFAEPNDVDAGFWMMWFAIRSFRSDWPETPIEFASVGFDRYQAIKRPRTSLDGFVTANRHAVIVTFRGSTDLTDWTRNFTAPPRSGSALGLQGRLHTGWFKAVEDVWPTLESVLRDFGAQDKTVWFTGHSLGAAVAHIAAAKFASVPSSAPRTLVTFAAPRAGDGAFNAASYRALNGRHHRYAVERDLVTHLPPTPTAADPFARVAKAGLLAGSLESLVRGFDYAHTGDVTRMNFESGAARLVEDGAANDGVNDWEFWSDFARKVHDLGIKAYDDVRKAQADRHDERAFLCRMRILSSLGF